MMNRIICAALRSKVTIEDNYYIILGVRHFDHLMNYQIQITFGEEHNKSKYWDQGFIDLKGKFRDRKEAFKIAKKANQIIKKTGGKNSEELFSEDLY